MLELQAPSTVQAVYDEFKAFVDNYLATAPPTLGTAFVWGDYAFTWMVTQQRLVRVENRF